MSARNSLLAWIEDHPNGRFLAAFVSAGTYDRPPATRLCGSANEARQWVEAEAASLTVPVTWVEQRPFR